jgi:hypothetical protein
MRPWLVVAIAAVTGLTGFSSVGFAMECVGGASCTKWKNNCTLTNPPRCTSECVQCGYPKSTTGTKATSKTMSGGTATVPEGTVFKKGKGSGGSTGPTRPPVPPHAAANQ